jgi:hypothetical protein
MSAPAKDEPALLKRAGEAIRKALIKPPGCTESTGCAVGPCHCAHLAAEASIAAIRAAGWAVVPARLTKDMEYDALRAENARLMAEVEWLHDLMDGMITEVSRWSIKASEEMEAIYHARAALEVKP